MAYNQQQHPILGKHPRIKDEGAVVGPTHEIDSKFKKEKQSTILEETEDIPVEVVAATMEAGKKRKSQWGLKDTSNRFSCDNATNPTIVS